MTKYLLSVFCFFSVVVYGQQKQPTEKELTQLFKESLTENSKAKGWISSEKEWIICNEDSAYYTADTINVYNNYLYIGSLNKCCNIACWSFYDKHSFRLSQSQVCQEPPLSIVYPNNLFKVKFKTVETQLYLMTYNGGKLIDNFKVARLETVGFKKGGDKCMKLMLVRMKK